MLFLTQLSVPRRQVDAVAKAHDPLAAADPGYRVKNWLETMPDGIKIRPYAWTEGDSAIRLTGWRATPPHGAPPHGVLVSTLEFRRVPGEQATFEVVVTPIDRVRRQGVLVEIDPGAGSTDPDRAYRTWALARLAEQTAFGVKEIAVIGRESRRVLRKIQRRTDGQPIQRLAERTIPVVTLRLGVTVRDPEGLDKWLLGGFSRSKAFGFGCATPC